MMATAEIQPLEFERLDQVAELRFKSVGGAFEGIGILLAECVKV